MPDSMSPVEAILFKAIGVAHLQTGGRLRLQCRDGTTFMAFESWADDYERQEPGQRGPDKPKIHKKAFFLGSVARCDKSKAPAKYEEAEHVFLAMLDQVRLHKMEKTVIEFMGSDATVGVTWRHLKARLDVLRMVLRQDEAVMNRIIEEAEAWNP